MPSRNAIDLQTVFDFQDGVNELNVSVNASFLFCLTSDA